LGWKVRFRHFVREISAPNARYGVAHRQYSQGKLIVLNGGPQIKHHRKIESLTATIATLEDGQECIFDLRIKSDYLS
jgi:hypothetical protein